MSSISKFGSEAKFPNGISPLAVPFDILMVGGGGGGGACDITFNRRAGGGGGGGAVIEVHNIPLLKGKEYRFVTGSGGRAATQSLTALDGGNTRFENFDLAPFFPSEYGQFSALGGCAGGTYLPVVVDSYDAGLRDPTVRGTTGCGGGGASGATGISNNNIANTRFSQGTPSNYGDGIQKSHIINEFGSVTSIIFSGYKGGNGFPFRQPLNNVAENYSGGGGGGAGGPGRDGFSVGSTLLYGGNGGPPYKPKWITRYNGIPIRLGSGGGGQIRGTTLTAGSTAGDNVIIVEGSGGNAGTTEGVRGLSGTIYISYPTSYGALLFTNDLQTPDTTSRPGYYIYKSNFGSLTGFFTVPS